MTSVNGRRLPQLGDIFGHGAAERQVVEVNDGYVRMAKVGALDSLSTVWFDAPTWRHWHFLRPAPSDWQAEKIEPDVGDVAVARDGSGKTVRVENVFRSAGWLFIRSNGAARERIACRPFRLQYRIVRR